MKPILSGLDVRLATIDDTQELTVLMRLAINQLQTPYLDAKQIEASFDIMGIDNQLIEDGTYFAVTDRGLIVGCGGWSRRATLYGGSHSAGRNSTLLDPGSEAARIRAMYTHPGHVRRGIGRKILEACEEAARKEGFKRAELMATLSGEPLYRACGYEVMDMLEAETKSGIAIPVRKMGKML